MEISNRIFQTYISITYLKSAIKTDINGKPPNDIDFRLVQPMDVHCGGKADCKEPNKDQIFYLEERTYFSRDANVPISPIFLFYLFVIQNI